MIRTSAEAPCGFRRHYRWSARTRRRLPQLAPGPLGDAKNSSKSPTNWKRNAGMVDAAVNRAAAIVALPFTHHATANCPKFARRRTARAWHGRSPLGYRNLTTSNSSKHPFRQGTVPADVASRETMETIRAFQGHSQWPRSMDLAHAARQSTRALAGRTTPDRSAWFPATFKGSTPNKGTADHRSAGCN